jgi:hypothetical protein
MRKWTFHFRIHLEDFKTACLLPSISLDVTSTNHLMYLDSVRRQAHRAASHHSGNQNYNPFSRVLSREAQTDEENQPHRSHSEAFITPDLEQQRHLESSAVGKEYGPPHHHNTEPSNASPTTALGSSSVPESSKEKDIVLQPDEEKKISSEDGTVVGSSRENSTGLTKRAKFKTLLRRENEDHDGEELQRVESEKLSMEERKRKAHKRKIPVGAQIKFVLFGAWINVLLIMVPVGFIVNYLHIGDVPVFVINFFAIIPLAAMLSSATEELALRVGETMGGLLNATFGYVAQLPSCSVHHSHTTETPSNSLSRSRHWSRTRSPLSRLRSLAVCCLTFCLSWACRSSLEVSTGLSSTSTLPLRRRQHLCSLCASHRLSFPPFSTTQSPRTLTTMAMPSESQNW